VYLPNRLGHIQGYDRSGQYGGWLGRAYNALATTIRKNGPGDNPYFRACTDAELDFRIAGLADSAELTLDRMDRRRSLLEQFENQQRGLLSERDSVHSRIRQQALDLITSQTIRNAV